MHTKGEWTVDNDPDLPLVVVCEGNIICEMGKYPKEKEANAYLIAAAPDMLEALRCSLIIFRWQTGEKWDAIISDVEAAIAKATQKEE